jgi:2-methylisocitrate lyase-like PEP mutase family enzyme
MPPAYEHNQSMTTANALRQALSGARALLLPSCFDALSASLVRQAGFAAGFISGYGLSAARIGQPDVGLISAGEMTDSVRAICNVTAGFPWIADGDEGYGNAMNARRTTVEYARAGAAAILLEDQVMPKRCGHFHGKQVVSREEACMKIRAAVDVRRETGLDILILARTDALHANGFEEALSRVLDFEQEGADILFIEALETEEQMSRFCRAVSKPALANNFAGGRTPCLARERLEELGVRLIMDATLIFSAARAMQNHLQEFAAGNTNPAPGKATFQQMADILGFQNYIDVADRYRT